jgi:hypothetical protein
MFIRVYVDIDIDTTDTDIEDLRDDLLDTVVEIANNAPEHFIFKPLEAA